jgi:hypothetical protein
MMRGGSSKRAREDGHIADDEHRATKLAKRRASDPAAPTQIRVRALHRPQGALRPLLEVVPGATDAKAASLKGAKEGVRSALKPVAVQTRARQPSGWGGTAAAGVGPAGVGIAGKRLFSTPEAKADKMGQDAANQRKAPRGVSPHRREVCSPPGSPAVWKPSLAMRAGAEPHAEQESRLSQAERRWCIAFFALLPALFLWIAWLYNLQDRALAPLSAKLASWVPPMVREQWREIAACTVGKQVAEALDDMQKIVLWVLRGLPALLMVNLITRAGHKTRLVGIIW